MRFYQDIEGKGYRCGVYVGRAGNCIFNLSANWLCGLAGLTLDANDEYWTLFVGVGLFSLFISIPGPRWSRPREPMTIGIRLHGGAGGAIWWDCWHTAYSWSSRTPRWRHGCFNPVAALFGELPPPGQPFPLEKRLAWLRACAAILTWIYAFPPDEAERKLRITIDEAHQ